MVRRKQVYKITYPNGKIYVGMDLTGAISYFGSPSAKERITTDLAEHRLDLIARKEILWESETATDAEVRAMERHFIRETSANNPAVGYNLTPRWSESEVGGTLSRMTAHTKLKTQQVRDAGQYFVAAEISRRGGYAVVTPGNRQGIDILANDVDHKRFIGIQVKTKNHQGRWVTSTRDGQPTRKACR